MSDHPSQDPAPASAGGELIEAQPRMTAVAPPTPMASMDPWNGQPEYVCNIDATTEVGQAMILRGLAQADLTSDDVIGQILDVEFALVQPVQLADRVTGEMIWLPRTVLYLVDGRTVGFVSGGIHQTLKAIAGFRGTRRWVPPLRVRVRQVTTRSKNRLLLLDLVVSEQPAPKKGGR